MLTPDQIQAFASRPNVKRTAVLNFLSSLGNETHQEAAANVHLDARSYGWNYETVGALREALVLFFSRK